VLGTVPCLAAQPTWALRAPASSPPATSFASAAYDWARDEVVMFGGERIGGAITADTWTWKSSTGTWTRRNVSGPPARVTFAFAYDPPRQVVVLFGGQATHGGINLLSDTWEWNGSAWQQRSFTTRPSARAGAKMAFDSQRNRLVLFGGETAPQSGNDETWTYDGNAWTQLMPGTRPPVRIHHAIAFDASRDRVVLFGGWHQFSYRGDTWEFDGVNWSPIAGPAPLARQFMTLAYDPLRSRTILFGGAAATGLLNDTWEYDAAGWRQRAPPGQRPSARCGHACDFDWVSERMLLFGGGDQRQNSVCCGDTFEYFHASPPTFLGYGAGCPGTGSRVPALANAALGLGGKLSLPWIGRTFRTVVSNARPMTPAWLGVGASNQRWLSLQLPFHLGVLGAPLCSVHASLDILVPGQTSANGEVGYALPIPDDPVLAGAMAYLQCVILDPQAPQNLLGVVLSNAGVVTLRSL
jgi:hypothetical protein